MNLKSLKKIIKDNKASLPVHSQDWKFEHEKPDFQLKISLRNNAAIPKNFIIYKIF